MGGGAYRWLEIVENPERTRKEVLAVKRITSRKGCMFSGTPRDDGVLDSP